MVLSTSASSQTVKYEPSQEEKDYLKNRFAQLTAVNPEAIAYVYAPGTELDEPVVQTTDNETYLNKTFDGGMSIHGNSLQWIWTTRKTSVIV